MKKNTEPMLSPGELYREVQIAVRHLGEVALTLGVTPPVLSDELTAMSMQEVCDLWTTSGASLRRLDQAWDDEAAKLVAQRLSVDAIAPAASESSS